MNDLRKAAEMACDGWENDVDSVAMDAMMQALRQALAHEALDEMVAENQRRGLYGDKPAVKTYAGGKPNYCTPLQSERIRIDPVTGDVSIGTVDAANMSQESVDETAKGEHEPIDWEAVAADQAMTIAMMKIKNKREWVGLTQDEVNSWELPDCPTVFEFAQFIEAKLKEKNS